VIRNLDVRPNPIGIRNLDVRPNPIGIRNPSYSSTLSNKPL